MNAALRLARYVHFCLADPMRIDGDYASRERFTSAVFISPKRDLLFVKNEKAGNNTARMTLQHLAAARPLPETFSDRNRWLAPMLMPSDLGLRSIDELNAIPFKFAIVRNPYSRTLSAWLNKFGKEGPKTERFKEKLGLSGAVSFAQFVEAIGRQTPSEMDPHWRVQGANIYAELIRYDRFVKFENYEAEFGDIMRRHFGSAPIRNVRKGETDAGAKIAAHYTNDIAKEVARIYASDFRMFGYSTDIARANEG
jgi:hypothetical protein